MTWSRAFQKCIFYHFMDNFFMQTFLLYNWIWQNKCYNFCKCANLQICKFANYFADFKSKAYDISNNVSFVMGHQTWDLEGGVVKMPPSSVSSWFSTPAGIGLRSFNCTINVCKYLIGFEQILNLNIK